MSSEINIHEAFRSILSSKNKKERIETRASFINLDIVNEIQQLMDKNSMSKAQLAERLGLSKSFITQIFTSDKNMSLKFIAQIQDIFDVKFNASFQPKRDNMQRAYVHYKTEISHKASSNETYKKINYNADEPGIDLDINNNPQLTPAINPNPCPEQIYQGMTI